MILILTIQATQTAERLKFFIVSHRLVIPLSQPMPNHIMPSPVTLGNRRSYSILYADCLQFFMTIRRVMRQEGYILFLKS